MHALYVGIIGVLTLTLAACGGGSSSKSPDTNVSIVVTGQIGSPAVQSARVLVRNAQDSARSAVIISNENGQASIPLSEKPQSQWYLVAFGGQQASTRLDMQGVTLLRALPSDSSSDAPFIVSPISTLSWQLLKQRGSDQLLSDWLGSDANALVNNPALTAASQLFDLQLGQVFSVLRTQSEALSLIADALILEHGDIAKAVELLSLNDSLPVSLQARLHRDVERHQRLQQLDTSTDGMTVLTAFNKTITQLALLHYVQEQLHTPTDTLSQTAVSRLADVLWQASGNRGLQPESATATNVNRYVFRTYNITAEDMNDDFTVPDALMSDTRIAMLANSNVIDTTLPLAYAELLSNNNQARLQYFLNSDQSPFNVVEQLFENIVDDTVLDPVLLQIATGLAESGLLDEAELIASSRIFNPMTKAEALRSIGRAAIRIDAKDRGVAFLDEAVRVTSQHIERIGLANIGFNETRLLQNISTDLGAIGEAEKADTALAPIRTYIQSQGGQSRPFSGNYNNLTTAVMSLADDNVQRAEEANMAEPRRQQAIDSVNLLRDLTDNFPGVGSPVMAACLLAGQYTARYGDLYRRLGLEQDAITATSTFKSYFTGRGCNEGPLAATIKAVISGYAPFIAPVYPTYQLGEEFNELLALLASDFWRDSMRNAAFVFELRQQMIAGETEEAIERLNAETTNLLTRMDNLTFDAIGVANRPFTGLGSRVLGTKRLFALSLDDNDIVSAQQLSNAAWELSRSTEYLTAAAAHTNAERRATDMFIRGCMRATTLALLLNDQQTAQARVRDCRNIIHEHAPANTTANQIRIDLLSRLAELYTDSGLATEAEQILVEAETSALLIDAKLTQSSVLAQQIAALLAHNGNETEAINTLTRLPVLLEAALTSATTEAERITALRAARTAARDIHTVRNIIRRNITIRGESSENQFTLLAEIQTLLHVLANGQEGSYTGLRNGAGLINNAQDKASLEGAAAEILVLADNIAAAREIALMANGAERHRRLTDISKLLLAKDDFPGSSLARFDYDGDGKPDFFSPQASPESIQESALELDTDIDGDGIPDDIDTTPYCHLCQAGA